MADKKFLDEDGVSQFAEETKKYVDKHADNADIHVTADDKANWNGKQDALTAEQLAAVNSGINATAKGNYDAHIANADIHVTTADKTRWNGKQDALTSQQIDNINDVVNKANASDLTDHTSNADIHVTTADKANWNGKQDALTSQQIDNINDVVNKANVSDLANYLPLSGGNLTNGDNSIGVSVDNNSLSLYGGYTRNTCSRLMLVGADANDWRRGGFVLRAKPSSSESIDLIGVPDGTLTWGGKTIDVIEEQGDGYIRYSNGIQICWVYAHMVDSVYTWNFPKTFGQNPVITATISFIWSDFNRYQRSVEVNNLSNTSVLLRADTHLFGDANYVKAEDFVNAIAIGRWK